jgi:hypothetical protein
VLDPKVGEMSKSSHVVLTGHADCELAVLRKRRTPKSWKLLDHCAPRFIDRLHDFEGGCVNRDLCSLVHWQERERENSGTRGWTYV